MSSNILNKTPYLRTSRPFPDDLDQLSIETNKAYVDTSLAVNARTIGLFSTGVATITGESWFLTNNIIQQRYRNNQKQQGFRQAYTFTSTSPIPHGLNFNNISTFTRCYGQYTDNTNWYGLINAGSTGIAGQISFYVTPTNIVFVDGGGSPAIITGVVVLEWLSTV
jgi:hypothetical protein